MFSLGQILAMSVLCLLGCGVFCTGLGSYFYYQIGFGLRCGADAKGDAIAIWVLSAIVVVFGLVLHEPLMYELNAPTSMILAAQVNYPITYAIMVACGWVLGRCAANARYLILTERALKNKSDQPE